MEGPLTVFSPDEGSLPDSVPRSLPLSVYVTKVDLGSYGPKTFPSPYTFRRSSNLRLPTSVCCPTPPLVSSAGGPTIISFCRRLSCPDSAFYDKTIFRMV